MDEKEKLEASLDQIHAEESLKTSTKKYLFEKVYFKEKKRSSPLRKFAAAAVCSLAVFIGGGSWLFFTPTAFISVDVNPSLELGINRFDRIVSVTGYNEDGRALARDLHIKYMDYTDALETLMEDQNMEVYMADNADVVLTVAGDNAAKSSEILDNVESCMSEHQNVYCHSGNSEEVHHAHDAGLSFGKYQAWQVLQDLDPDITLEEVQDMTMSEIRDLIWKYSQEKSPAKTSLQSPKTYRTPRIRIPARDPRKTPRTPQGDPLVKTIYRKLSSRDTMDTSIIAMVSMTSVQIKQVENFKKSGEIPPCQKGGFIVS